MYLIYVMTESLSVYKLQSLILLDTMDKKHNYEGLVKLIITFTFNVTSKWTRNLRKYLDFCI